ncbi:M6 family metalloprotease domain-containing protein [Allokutzneria albata]|uniref:M6 family metalloprotease domain-containing protein n=1 Tax=Allokutzneria albata TaxID=211114 RepID=A0A1G9R3T3_ALLAB|nr:M6 family metalloprotease domain-containing protein [Allokutzneria albata]
MRVRSSLWRLLALAAATVVAVTAPSAVSAAPGNRSAPIDPKNWENPQDMTWSDYRKVPGTNWADPNGKPTKRTFKGALVLADYPDQDFVVTKPPRSDVFGNPSQLANNIPRAQVAKFYQDFLNKPNAVNRGHTLHEYWMEASGGRIGVELTAFGAYRMPGKSYEYGMEFQGSGACPEGSTCNRDLRADAGAAWRAEVGNEVPKRFDFVFFLSAGQDESSTWQEFGEMLFQRKEDVPDSFGPPDPKLPNWAKTRYVEWTSWKAASAIWPNAGGGSSTQAESSGHGTFAHELSHILGIGDNYNNPFGKPPVRAYTGPWEMMSRGTFNGPGGTHTRWKIPPDAGGAMGSHHMLRTKAKLGMVDPAHILQLERDALAKSGVITARVTAREVQPGKGGLMGLNIAMKTGDKSPKCSQGTDPFCDGGGYNNYTVEVVDRMGADSFTPDSGVLFTKTKNADATPFEWIIDANPADIDLVDFYRPDGTPVKVTVGDPRQLADAPFRAGTNSGSKYEYVDTANRLHLYVADIHRDPQGVLSYTVAVRSLDGAGPHTRGLALGPSAASHPDRAGVAQCTFPLANTGRTLPVTGQPQDVSSYVDGDVYRLRATAPAGYEVRLPNELAAVKVGKKVDIPLNVVRTGGPAGVLAEATLTATSESDPTKTATARCLIPTR